MGERETLSYWVLPSDMIVNKRCTVCHGEIGESEIEHCGNCGLTVHTECAEFVRTFDCRECADELAVGAVEL